jgi:hypothetical protein
VIHLNFLFCFIKFSLFLWVGNLCNNAQIGEGGKIYGQPTEMALLDVVIRGGMVDERMVKTQFVKQHVLFED